jgi:hypothetical protein
MVSGKICTKICLILRIIGAWRLRANSCQLVRLLVVPILKRESWQNNNDKKETYSDILSLSWNYFYETWSFVKHEYARKNNRLVKSETISTTQRICVRGLKKGRVCGQNDSCLGTKSPQKEPKCLILVNLNRMQPHDSPIKIWIFNK